MAGDWIKMRVDLHEDEAVFGIANMLKVDRYAVVGMLHRLWSWADAQLTDGHAKSVTTSNLDAIIGVTGFANALLKVGWLTLNNGGVSIPKFDRHLSEGAKTRIRAVERKRKQRKPPQRPSQKCHKNVPPKVGPEKRREEKSNTPPTPPRGDAWTSAVQAMTTGGLDTEHFKSAWLKWVQHRKEFKKPLKPTMVESQIRQMEKWGSTRAVAAIEHTIFKGWIGLREPGDVVADNAYDSRAAFERAKRGVINR